MEKKAIACIAQPIDRAYNLHGGGRREHLEFFHEPISYAIRAQVAPLVAEWEQDNAEQNNLSGGDTRPV